MDKVKIMIEEKCPLDAHQKKMIKVAGALCLLGMVAATSLIYGYAKKKS